MYENNYLEVDLDVIKENARAITKKYDEYEYKIAMVKGNAYGHGMYVVNTLIENGFNYLAVSSLDEALNIRNYNKKIGILCTQPIDLKYIDEILKNDITISISNLSYLKELKKVLKKKIKVHFAIDSGMNRFGFNNELDLKRAFKLIDENIEVEGIYSHFATTGVIDKKWDEQVSRFKSLLSSIDISKIKMIHLANSFSLLSHPKIDICNGFRVGSSVFGIKTFPIYSTGIKDKIKLFRNKLYKKIYGISDTYHNVDIDLKLAISLHSKVIEIKEIEKGQSVGYGTSYIANENKKIAIIDIGYEDGLPRCNNDMKVVINKKCYNVIGEIGMCLIFAEIDERVKIGDTVDIISDNIRIGNFCRLKNQSVHEVLISLGKLNSKKYIKDNKIVYETYNTESRKEV